MEDRALRGVGDDLIAEAARFLGPAAEGLLKEARQLTGAIDALDRNVDQLRSDMKDAFASCKAELRSQMHVTDHELDRLLREVKAPSS